jgi:hypothetical protein
VRILRVLEKLGADAIAVAERHDLTYMREREAERLRLVLELAYPDRERFTIEEDADPAPSFQTG